MLESMPWNKDLQTLINAFRPHRGESIYPDTYGNAVVYSELQQAILIPIQQNNSFTHFLSYNSQKTYALTAQEIMALSIHYQYDSLDDITIYTKSCDIKPFSAYKVLMYKIR